MLLLLGFFDKGTSRLRRNAMLYRCPKGYTGDGTICEDVNECKVFAGAVCHKDAICINTKGSYRCLCKVRKQADALRCPAQGGSQIPGFESFEVDVLALCGSPDTQETAGMFACKLSSRRKPPLPTAEQCFAVVRQHLCIKQMCLALRS